MKVRIKDEVWEKMSREKEISLYYDEKSFHYEKRSIFYKKDWFPLQVFDCNESNDDKLFEFFIKGYRARPQQILLAKCHVEIYWFEPVKLPEELFKI